MATNRGVAVPHLFLRFFALRDVHARTNHVVHGSALVYDDRVGPGDQPGLALFCEPMSFPLHRPAPEHFLEAALHLSPFFRDRQEDPKAVCPFTSSSEYPVSSWAARLN